MMIIDQDVASALILVCKFMAYEFPRSKRKSSKQTQIIIYKIYDCINKSGNKLLKDYVDLLRLAAAWQQLGCTCFNDMLLRITSNILEEDLRDDIPPIPEQTINEKEEEVVKSLTEYTMNTDNFLITDFYF